MRIEPELALRAQWLQGAATNRREDLFAQLSRGVEDTAVAVQLVPVACAQGRGQLLGAHAVAGEHGEGLDVEGEAGRSPVRPERSPSPGWAGRRSWSRPRRCRTWLE